MLDETVVNVTVDREVEVGLCVNVQGRLRSWQLRQVVELQQLFVDSSECVFKVWAQEGRLCCVVAMLAIILVGVVGAIGCRNRVFLGKRYYWFGRAVVRCRKEVMCESRKVVTY